MELLQSKTGWGIRTKVIILVTVAIAAAQLIIGGILLWREAQRYAAAKRDTMLAAAQILASTAGPAVAAGNAHGVR